jgi:hypothetical protein
MRGGKFAPFIVYAFLALYNEGGRSVMKTTVLIFILLFSARTYAMTEFSGEFGYKKQVYGSGRENDLVTRTYSSSIAFYFLSSTALEFNYYNQEDVTTETNTISITGSGYSVVGMQNKVRNYSYGVGLRQALAPKGAWLRPTISLGYARQFSSDFTTYTFKQDSTGTRFTSADDINKQRHDSVFATFGIQLALTKALALRASVNTLFTAFKFDQARDNVKYLVGFTWYF